MVKMVQLLVKREGDTHEEFVERWRGEHAEMAKDLPGLQKYTTAVPNDPERASHDGVVELYFEDMDALAAAFDSEVGKRSRPTLRSSPTWRPARRCTSRNASSSRPDGRVADRWRVYEWAAVGSGRPVSEARPPGLQNCR